MKYVDIATLSLVKESPQLKFSIRMLKDYYEHSSYFENFNVEGMNKCLKLWGEYTR